MSTEDMNPDIRINPDTQAAPVCLWPLGAHLGEGPLWLRSEQSLYFVDIKRQTLHRFRPADGHRRQWALPQMIGWVIPSQRGLLVGLQQGIARLVLSDTSAASDSPDQVQGTVQLEWLHRLHGSESPMRLNDAKADAHGAIWFGSMNDANEADPAGALYRLAPSGQIELIEAGYCVPNGPALSRDGRTLYHADSALRRVYAYTLDAAGQVLGKRLWQEFSPDWGYPDGMTVDSEDALWIAHWAAGMVTRWRSDGQLLAKIRVPATRPTSIAFGGPDWHSLFITSAGLNQIGPDGHSEGGLFVWPSTVAGLPPAMARVPRSGE